VLGTNSAPPPDTRTDDANYPLTDSKGHAARRMQVPALIALELALQIEEFIEEIIEERHCWSCI